MQTFTVTVLFLFLKLILNISLLDTLDLGFPKWWHSFVFNLIIYTHVTLMQLGVFRYVSENNNTVAYCIILIKLYYKY